MKYKTKISRVSKFGILLVLAAIELCCSNEGEKETPTISAKLPTMVVSGSEGTDFNPLSGQAWIRSMDLVAVGEVVSVSLENSPAFELSGSSYRQVDGCAGIVEPAMEIEVRISHSIHGRAEGNITFRIGTEQVLTFSPRPSVGPEAGSIAWSSPGNPNDSGITPGSTLGFGLRQIPGASGWSAMGEPLFTMMDTESGIVSRFQEVVVEGQDSVRIPQGIEGKTVEELRAMADDDTHDAEAESYRAWMTNLWGSPLFSYGALCSIDQGNTEPELPEDQR
ncbi:MAG: hypothetical protein RBU45_20660 [Myxococcota bacterium]|jgi:hypothetical protein|nr:hypothetical protein [Myxococcota bacterium]